MWFSAANPVECNVSALVGKALWATVPLANISAVLASLAQTSMGSGPGEHSGHLRST